MSTLPSKPSLEHLKKQAKKLLKAHRSGKLEACARIKTSFSRLSKYSETEILHAKFCLQDAQQVIAHEYGFPNWLTLSTTIKSASTVGLWHFGEGTGRTARDSSSSKNHGTLQGGATWNTNGKFGSAIFFDGVSGGVQIANPFSGEQPTWTIEAWFKLFSLAGPWPNVRTIFRKRAIDNDVIIWIRPGGRIEALDWTNNSVICSEVVQPDTWCHIAYVFDETEFRLYINGKLEDTAPSFFIHDWSKNYIRTDIGDNPTDKNVIDTFHGLIDEVRISSVARSSKELSRNANHCEKQQINMS